MAVVVVIVVQTTTLPGVGAEDAVRIGKLCFNLVLKYLLPTAVSITQGRGYAQGNYLHITPEGRLKSPG